MWLVDANRRWKTKLEFHLLCRFLSFRRPKFLARMYFIQILLQPRLQSFEYTFNQEMILRFSLACDVVLKFSGTQISDIVIYFILGIFELFLGFVLQTAVYFLAF
jgi:hypothetical protein